MTFAKELIQSANEALAIAEGRAEPAAVLAPETIDVERLSIAPPIATKLEPENVHSRWQFWRKK